MLSDELQIYKDTFKLCKILMSYSKNVSRLVRYGEYGVAISKACTSLDLIRRINESFEQREVYLHDYILLVSEVKSRITLFAEAEFLSVKAATNLDYQINKIAKEATGWLKAEKARKARTVKP